MQGPGPSRVQAQEHGWVDLCLKLRCFGNFLPCASLSRGCSVSRTGMALLLGPLGISQALRGTCFPQPQGPCSREEAVVWEQVFSLPRSH